MSKKERITLALLILISGGILAFSMRNIPFAVLYHHLLNINWWWLGLAIGAMLLSLLAEALIVYSLVKPDAPFFQLKTALRVPAVEQLFNGITPFCSGGAPAEIIALKQSGIPLAKATSCILIKFMMFELVCTSNFLLCMLVGLKRLKLHVHYLAWIVILCFIIHVTVIGCLLLIIYCYSLMCKIANYCLVPLKWLGATSLYEKWQPIVAQKIKRFYQQSVHLRSHPKLVVRLIIYTSLQLFFYYIVAYFVLLALGTTQDNFLIVYAMNVLILMIVSLVPIPGGVGGAEYSFSLIFSMFLRDRGQLVLAMILWRLITYYGAMFLGLLALFFKPDVPGEVKAPTKQGS